MLQGVCSEISFNIDNTCFFIVGENFDFSPFLFFTDALLKRFIFLIIENYWLTDIAQFSEISFNQRMNDGTEI